MMTEKDKMTDSGANDQLSLLAATRAMLDEFNLKAKKSLAQHFLIDRGILNKIVAAADLKPDDTVIEVGPGLGVLTQALAGRVKHLIAVEIDRNMVAVLRRIFGMAPNVGIIERDILDADPSAVLIEAGAAPGPTGPFKYKVVANLPYYITSAVMRHFLEAALKPELIVVMMQKEVAEQITALPGAMSLLSVSVQYYGTPRIVRTVSRGCFFPAPDVDSALLRVDVHPEPRLPPEDDEGFFRVVHAGFTAPRKQLANAIAQGFRGPKGPVLSWLAAAGIDPARRAETLSVSEWVHLYETYREGERPDDQHHRPGQIKPDA
jgi:16S rRNA (adenine1518-N6/adenine1519-N6)-dimethyltransferase